MQTLAKFFYLGGGAYLVVFRDYSWICASLSFLPFLSFSKDHQNIAHLTISHEIFAMSVNQIRKHLSGTWNDSKMDKEFYLLKAQP